jgi:hypothetical protein
MRIAYISTDEVNQALAGRMAAASGAVLDVLLPQDGAADGRCDAVLHDLDHVPRSRRQEVLAHLLSGSSPCPQGVHSYDVSEEQAADLRRHGVAVSRRLGLELISTLCRAVDQHQASLPSGRVGPGVRGA